MSPAANKPQFKCPDCFGTGRSKKGGPCKTCRGSGQVGKVAAGFGAFMALARIIIVLIVVVAIIVAVVSSGSGSKHSASHKTTAAREQWQKDGLVGPEVEQCYQTLPFATKRLCNTEWEAALTDFQDPSSTSTATDFVNSMPRLFRRCRRHASPDRCGFVIGQSLSIAAKAY